MIKLINSLIYDLIKSYKAIKHYENIPTLHKVDD